MTTLRDIAELGYMCGIDRLGQAVTYAECHWAAYPPGALEQLNREIEEAVAYEVSLDMLCVHFLGEERCRELDAELAAYFAQEHNGDSDDEREVFG